MVGFVPSTARRGRISSITRIIPFTSRREARDRSSSFTDKGRKQSEKRGRCSRCSCLGNGTRVEIIRINTRLAGSILFVNPVNQSRSPLVSLRPPYGIRREAFLIGSPWSLITSTTSYVQLHHRYNIAGLLMKFMRPIPLQTVNTTVRFILRLSISFYLFTWSLSHLLSTYRKCYII